MVPPPYSQTTLNHFFEPRRAHRMPDPDAVGKAGRLEGGPFMVIYLKIEGDKITDASFQSYGCGPGIAAGSVVAESVVGLTLAQARKWDEPAINNALGGLPEEKRHCSKLAANALVDALSQVRT